LLEETRRGVLLRRRCERETNFLDFQDAFEMKYKVNVTWTSGRVIILEAENEHQAARGALEQASQLNAEMEKAGGRRVWHDVDLEVASVEPCEPRSDVEVAALRTKIRRLENVIKAMDNQRREIMVLLRTPAGDRRE
jgi:hypothetical protein